MLFGPDFSAYNVEKRLYGATVAKMAIKTVYIVHIFM